MIFALFFMISTLPVELDKAAHFSTAAAINFSCYQVAKKVTESKPGSLALCSVATLGVGVAKELYDQQHDTGFDSKDLLADVLGIGFSAVFLSLDF